MVDKFISEYYNNYVLIFTLGFYCKEGIKWLFVKIMKLVKQP
jgi:hypothetical protein